MQTVVFKNLIDNDTSEPKRLEPVRAFNDTNTQ